MRAVQAQPIYTVSGTLYCALVHVQTIQAINKTVRRLVDAHDAWSTVHRKQRLRLRMIIMHLLIIQDELILELERLAHQADSIMTHDIACEVFPDDGCTHGADCVVHTGVNSLHNFDSAA